MSDPLNNTALSSSSPQEWLRPVRIDLSEAYTMEGEIALLKMDFDKAVECFESATQLDPKNSQLFFTQGLHLFDFGACYDDDRAWFLAYKKFKIATTLDPHHFDTHRIFGALLLGLGIRFKEISYFKAAKEKLSHALNLGTNQEKTVLAELNWDLGVTFTKLAEHSQEALDWHQSIQAFEVAKGLDDSLPADFWMDYGFAQLKLASSLNDIRAFVKAVHSFKKTIQLNPEEFEGYRLLAQTMQKLYFYTHDKEHFEEACEYFSQALALRPDITDLLLEYAELLSFGGEKEKDLKALRQSVDLCVAGLTLKPKDPDILATWARSLIYLSHFTERLDLLHEVQRKIEAIPEAEKTPSLLLSEGLCLKALGRYFEESDYEYQAIEKFQEGLSLNRTQHRLWHAMATSYAFLGEKEEDEENFKLAIRFFQKALDVTSSTYYQFDYARTLFLTGSLLNQEKWLEQALKEFEHLFQSQRNALYLHPEWLLTYGRTLDFFAGFHDDPLLYEKAIEIFSHILSLNPDFPSTHHYLALTLTHLGDLNMEKACFERAIYHYRLAFKQEENDEILVNLATTLIHTALCSNHSNDSDILFHDAQQKLEIALRQGNTDAYYVLACLYSLTQELDKSLYYLEKAYLSQSCPPLEEILEDEWLEELRSTSAFQAFLQHFSSPHQPHDEL